MSSTPGTIPSPLTLDQLARGESGVIIRISGERALRRRLLDMGLTTGETVTLTAIAPLGDPIELTLKGYRLSLRRAEASLIIMERSDAPAS